MKILKNERDWQRDNQRKKKKKKEMGGKWENSNYLFSVFSNLKSVKEDQ